ncbi:MAG: hypothetical protein E7211_21450 [Clostridium lundense]|nr:hypothetical protein [Clostridium lundense]
MKRTRAGLIIALALAGMVCGVLALHKPDDITYTAIDSWPQTEYTALVPAPTEGKPIKLISLNKSQGVELEKCSEKIYCDYISNLQNDGFTIQKEVNEQDSQVSLLTKGKTSVQVSYSNGSLLVAISDDGFRK